MNNYTLPGLELRTPYQRGPVLPRTQVTDDVQQIPTQVGDNVQMAGAQNIPTVDESKVYNGPSAGRWIRDIALTLLGAWPELAAAEGLDALNRKEVVKLEEEPKKEEPKVEVEVEEKEEPEDDREEVEYTYKPGDTFGQVILDLGLDSGAGLWGDDGDVEYYTQQLMDQGIWEDGQRGNIPIGTTIKLKRRPVPENIKAYYDQYGYGD